MYLYKIHQVPFLIELLLQKWCYPPMRITITENRKRNWLTVVIFIVMFGCFCYCRWKLHNILSCSWFGWCVPSDWACKILLKSAKLLKCQDLLCVLPWHIGIWIPAYWRYQIISPLYIYPTIWMILQKWISNKEYKDLQKTYLGVPG